MADATERGDAYRQSQREYQARFRERHRERIRAEGAKWHRDKRANETPAQRAERLEAQRDWRLKTWTDYEPLRTTVYNHGLTLDQYHALMERQDFGCAICGHVPTECADKYDRLHIDHCHATERVRGLLCGGCNLGVGHFREDQGRMVAAMAYLAKHKGNIDKVVAP